MGSPMNASATLPGSGLASRVRACGFGGAPLHGRRTPEHPFILADDLGYADLGCYGSRHIETPALDALAAAGIRLTQAYANSPVCSATRTALITGRYPQRFAVGLAEPIRSDGRDPGMEATTSTLPAMLRARGYRTSLIGSGTGFAARLHLALRLTAQRLLLRGGRRFAPTAIAPGKAAAWDGL